MGGILRSAEIRALPVAGVALRLSALQVADETVLRALDRDPRVGVRTLAARLRREQARRLREEARLQTLHAVEDRWRAEGFLTIAGVDEAGVAPLAGPGGAAAVIMQPDLRLSGLDDSKRLSGGQRDLRYAEITRHARAVGIGRAEVEEIDRLNILQAMRLAHRRAILALPIRPHLVLIDGRYPADVPVPQLAIVDGDATCASIAAASIVAKVTRDRLMVELAAQYPGYGFEVHKGYSTRAHRAAITRRGLTPVHRRSFLFVQGFQQRLAIG